MSPPRPSFVSSVWANGIFNNRVVFVTGGAGSICSAQTRALVYLGADACIIGRNVDKTERVAREIAQVRVGARVLGIGGVDVRNFESLNNAAARCAKELGAIDFVIAGAAGNFVAPLSGLSPNGFKSVMEIDTLGTFNTIKATIPYLVQSAAQNPSPSQSSPSSPLTGGRILAVSVTFHYTGMPLQAHVSAAKAGVDSLMASVALEYGPLGVTANVVAPGAIAGTEGMERLAGGATRASGIPSGRLGSVRDIADATVYLFSDAGNYVNGTNIVVDGAAWRRHGSMAVGVDQDMHYPDFLLSGKISQRLRDRKKGNVLPSKAKL